MSDPPSVSAQGQRSVAAGSIRDSVVVTGDNASVNLSTGFPDPDKSETVLAYLVDRFQYDTTLKFKQTDLESQEIQQLYIDLPLIKMKSRYYEESTLDDDAIEADVQSPADGAGHSILHGLLRNKVIAIFGGPGGGKSTLLQYISQVYRAILTNNVDFLSQIPEAHATVTPRIPLRCDLKDLAQWFGGGDPYSLSKTVAWRTQGQEGRSLEGLIAHSIRCFSGGASFSVDDLRIMFKNYPILLALDGLDEVASSANRRTVADEIGRAVARLNAIASDLIVVVTSRPTADPAKHLLPTRFAHYRIGSLDAPLANEYLQKWLTQRQLSQEDVEELLNVYHDRSDEPHVKYLTRNPMQLAILLHLMHTRGYSLPNLRTLMYEDYVRLFFDREATKSVAVRDNRSVLESLHNFLGWTLQSRAEGNPQGGRIEQEDLREIIKNHLRRQELPAEEAEVIFSASTQRILMLVERIEGAFEFEVQPIREFFAARYLHVTAPYAQAGAETSSTRGTRLAELCLHPYWLNTVRFLAGFFQEGELADLVDVLTDLMQALDTAKALYVREVLLLLLQDQIFSRKPRVIRRAFDNLFLGNDLAIRVLSSQDVPMIFDSVSTKQALNVLLKRLYFSDSSSQIRDISVILRRIASLKRGWWIAAKPDNAEEIEKWLKIGAMVGALEQWKEVELIWQDILAIENVGDILISGNVDIHPRMVAADVAFDSMRAGASWHRRLNAKSALTSLDIVIRPSFWFKLDGRTRGEKRLVKAAMNRSWSPAVGSLLEVWLAGEFTSDRPVNLLNGLVAIFGDCLATRRIAIAAAAIERSRPPSHNTYEEREEQEESEVEKEEFVFVASSPRRLYETLHRMNGDVEWWQAQRMPLTDEWQIASWLLAVAMFPPKEFSSLNVYVEADLATLSQRFTDRLLRAVQEDSELCREADGKFPQVGPRTTCLLSPRFVTKRDQAWRRIAERPELLTNVMAMGDAARTEAVRSLVRGELGRYTYQGKGKLNFLEMLGPSFPVPAELTERLEFTADEVRRLASDPYRWPLEIVVSASLRSEDVDEERPSVADVAERMRWFE
jgi:hypothetical protein